MNFPGSTLCSTSNRVRVKRQMEIFISSQFIVTAQWPSICPNIKQFHKMEMHILFNLWMGTRGRMRFDAVGVATALIRMILVGSSMTNLVIKDLRTRNRNIRMQLTTMRDKTLCAALFDMLTTVSDHSSISVGVVLQFDQDGRGEGRWPSKGKRQGGRHSQTSLGGKTEACPD